MPSNHTEEQRQIIRRMGELSAQLDVAVEANHVANTAITHKLDDLGTELNAAMQRLNEIHTLAAEHGRLFRECLSTL